MKRRIPKLSRPIVAGLVSVILLLLTAVAGAFVQRMKADADCTILWSSAQSGENRDVEQRLKNGLDPDCQCGEAMKRAVEFNHQDTVDLLKRYGAAATDCKQAK